MALINPSSLYSGGNARLDSTPYLRMAMQQRARKQALDATLYKHYSELPDKINSAGVRLQDFDGPHGGINQDIGDLKEYFMNNTDNILRGGKAQQLYAQKIQGVMQKIGQSKSTAAFQMKSGQDFFNGKHDYDEGDLAVKNAVEQSIYDPAHYKDPDTKMPYTFNDYSVAAPPYTPEYQLKHDKVVTANIQPDKLPDDKGVFDPIAKKVTYNYGYTPEKAHEIVQTGLATLPSDRTMYRAMKKSLQDPAQIEIASKALQQDYDRTHTDGMKVIVDTPEEMYAGLQLNKFLNAKIPKTSYDKKSIDEYNASEWNRRNAITNAQRVKAAALSSQRKDARVKAMLNYNIEDPYEKATLNPVKLDYPDGTTKDLYSLEGLSPTEKEDLLGKGTGGQQYQNYPVEIGGKQYLQKGKNGELLNDQGDEIDREQPFINRYKRMGTVKKGQAKGELHRSSESTKPMSLAERMKAARNK